MCQNISYSQIKFRGFTLIEVLTAIAIMGILVSLLIPAIQAAREVARPLSCANNVKQISLATLSHESQFGRFPTGIVPVFGKRHYATWLQDLLPFTEQQVVYDRAIADYQISVIPFGHRGMRTLEHARTNYGCNFFCYWQYERTEIEL